MFFLPRFVSLMNFLLFFKEGNGCPTRPIQWKPTNNRKNQTRSWWAEEWLDLVKQAHGGAWMRDRMSSLGISGQAGQSV
jgi:hypothetical protein